MEEKLCVDCLKYNSRPLDNTSMYNVNIDFPPSERALKRRYKERQDKFEDEDSDYYPSDADDNGTPKKKTIKKKKNEQENSVDFKNHSAEGVKRKCQNWAISLQRVSPVKKLMPFY